MADERRFRVTFEGQLNKGAKECPSVGDRTYSEATDLSWLVADASVTAVEEITPPPTPEKRAERAEAAIREMLSLARGPYPEETSVQISRIRRIAEQHGVKLDD